MSSTMLALVTDAFGGRGGIAQYNRDFLSAVGNGVGRDAEIRVVVLPRHRPDEETPPIGIDQRGPISSRIGYALRALLAAAFSQTDIVFCGHLYMAPLALAVARLKGASLIIQAHGIEAWRRPSRLQRRAVEKADLVLSVSRYTRSQVLDWADIAPERVVVVPNTVRDAFTPGEGTSLRESLGLTGKKIVLTVGRMDAAERYKGHDLVIAAIPKLTAQGQDVAYVIVGDGDDRPRLEQLAKDFRVHERVHFLGAVEPPMLNEAYRMADLFVMPSTGEGFGIAFLEAMASGTPVVGLAVAGARDALADGALGVATTKRDLSKTIVGELRHGSKPARRLVKAVHERFGWDVFQTNARRALLRLKDAA